MVTQHEQGTPTLQHLSHRAWGSLPSRTPCPFLSHVTQGFCFSTQGSTGCSSIAAYPLAVNKRDIKQTKFSVRFEKCQARQKQAGSGRILTTELLGDVNMLVRAGNPRLKCTLKHPIRTSPLDWCRISYSRQPAV